MQILADQDIIVAQEQTRPLPALTIPTNLVGDLLGLEYVLENRDGILAPMLQ